MPRLLNPPVTALGALMRERRGAMSSEEIADLIGVNLVAFMNWEAGRARLPRDPGPLCAWLGIEVAEMERLAATPHEHVVEGPDALARAALAKRGRRQLAEVGREIDLAPTKYRRVELGGGSTEARAKVAAWCGVDLEGS